MRSVGWRPIHYCCDLGAEPGELARLLRNGSDPTARSHAGETPTQVLDLGARTSHSATSTVLRQSRVRRQLQHVRRQLQAAEARASVGKRVAAVDAGGPPAKKRRG